MLHLACSFEAKLWKTFGGLKKAVTLFSNCVQETEIDGLLRSGKCVKRKSLIVEDFWLNLKTFLYCPNIEAVIGNREGGTKYSHYAQFRVWVTTCVNAYSRGQC